MDINWNNLLSMQESVLSLEDLLEGNDSVTFDHCSMFIDEWLPFGA